MLFKNSKGQIFYGMHFYPGVAEYQEPGKDPYRVFLNEDTLRSMDPTFAGRPIFVEHVDEVEENIDLLKRKADGWVIESFFNAADGKHWVKFIVVSEKAERAIKNGFRLSNAYVPKTFGAGGHWNGVAYQQEVKSGEFDHLAIVRHPRYEESVIMSPEQFKKYNEENLIELKRLANSKEKGESDKMAFKFFKKAKVENSADLEGMCVILPKSGKEITIEKLINDADSAQMDMNAGLADLSHKVKMQDGSHMSVGDLLEKHKAMNDELAALKEKKKNDEEIEEGEKDLGDHGGDKSVENADDEEAKKKAEEEAAAKKKNEADDAAKKAKAKEKADALKNANTRVTDEEPQVVYTSEDRVSLGKSRYGSN